MIWTLRQAFVIVIVGVLLCTAVPSRAQQKGQWVIGQYRLNAGVIPDAGFTYQNLALNYSASILNESNGNLVQEPQSSPQASPQPQGGTTPDNSSTRDSNWHFAATPYLWFSGVHGTVGVGGFDASVHARFRDVLSNLDIGFMAVSELRYKRLLLPLDLMWVKLSDDKALPIQVVAITASAKMQNFFLNPGVGYRFVETPRLTVDGFTGFRYWHLGASLKFEPNLLRNTLSTSQNWVDPLLGARLQTPLGPKLRFTLFGDVGGFRAGSQLEWQVMPALGYQLNKRFTLQAGYRYLDVNYGSGGFKYDVRMSGLLLGTTIRFN